MTKFDDVTLYMREGSSDKVYQAWIEETDAGCHVRFAYGRRGGALKDGMKTKAPVSIEEAQKIHSSLVREKTGKGYAPGGALDTYVPPETTRSRKGPGCQLLKPMEDDEVEGKLADPNWLMQVKYDGKRVQIGREDGIVYALNRRGLPCAIPGAVAAAVAALPPGDLLLDGELVGEHYHAFDVLVLDGFDFTGESCIHRFERLSALLSRDPNEAMSVAECAYEEESKRALYSAVYERTGEGVVFKAKHAPYTPGEGRGRAATQLKKKFVERASVRVAALNEQRSVAIEVIGPGAEWTPVGNVTVPANQDVPAVGSLVDVEYLYAYPGGSLYQPVFIGPRDDLEEIDCTFDQLKMKPEAPARSVAR